ncbi:2-succinyl-5-enolpyruvyl-6-hydroxy-3-cyclohexene-1-carboxylic-acid synthase [Kocuria rhizophila]|uniref:2-succinyl-5-enolpyruvyl-6-hydroxy-3- cyclohexene-1-carboxylic-acid synthase n=1 Tax=Kocuria rhizophila TaxID=72000 RepID=UPI001ABDFDFE|nr:2-succinyl-5-enolpyruvyl-6-hydroxy-3-cyclohexene-1-carboxylic-acid synthase [Kocuria rhizophila]MBO4145786.1 2-succinyl-5-enolpyruvyl-6-hydroxy-3-cyclohexene-1-carboxylic-acid synthase [Kocuria rhizophila]MDN3225542.1 2-succinyl-5-enolpyruvyl-6-hydroxy-3-cyclohexene-1-carboxylic-acid synthase [Kocuria rhizophila]QTK32022.1 2-succinyl-5-enolpyruvyl-6-hydroxy-3-cyclohexene-1-carboxylic-acid synthase [Kocuria rhizophila]
MITPSILTATTVLRALAERGMRHLVVSPGSRSAPLAYAAAAAHATGALSVHVRIDERDAAFTALGVARSTGHPCAVLTTSGTAVGELLPAVMEASHAGVPVVVLSADRPPELRGTGANQTTRQPGLFSTFVRAEVDVLPPRGTGTEAEQRAEIDAALQPPLAVLVGDGETAPGPVQLNIALRDPLYPVSDEDHEHLKDWAREVAAELRGTRSDGPSDLTAHPWSVLPEPFLPAGAPTDDASTDGAPTNAPTAPLRNSGTASAPSHPVVFAGDGAGRAAARFAREHGIPLLAEPSSNAREGEAIASYESLLDTTLGRQIDIVVLVGRPTLSRAVSALLRRPGVQVVAVRPEPAPWFEPGRRPETEVRGFAEAASAVGTVAEGWLGAWREAGDAADAAVLRYADGQEQLTRLHVARAVWDASCRDGSVLVVGSSTVVRDVDLVARADSPVPVIANRGLAGIDGTVATAFGVGLGTGRPVRAVMGDLTFLHDAGGLLVGPGEQVPDAHLVVVNDSGGGIFQTLEHGGLGLDERYTAAVERFFGTPHRAGVAQLCAAYSVEHVRVDTVEDLTAALAEPVGGRRVIEVPVSRETLRDVNAAARQAGARAAQEHLAGG